VLLFHGCGGVQAHLDAYAQAAAEAGVRAFVVDSFAPRGWGRRFGLTLVCTGARFGGAERAGDVLAALHGIAARPDVDPARLGLAGWSHGAWAMMDLMTMPLTRPGEARLADPSPAPLAGLKSLSFFYAYVGLGTRGGRRPWLRAAPALAVVAERDHLAKPARHAVVHRRCEAAGGAVRAWIAEGVGHAFDQPDENGAWPPPRLANQALQSRDLFADHLRRTLVEAAPAQTGMA